MRDREELALAVDDLRGLISTISLLVQPIDVDINKQGTVTYDDLQGSFSVAMKQLDQIAEELRNKNETE